MVSRRFVELTSELYMLYFSLNSHNIYSLFYNIKLISTKFSMSTCLICFVPFKKQNPAKSLPSCSYRFCNDCLTNWVLEQITTLNDIHKDKIKCPFTACQHKNALPDYIRVLTSPQIVRIYDSLAKKYCQTTSDIRNCPNTNCNNYGFLCPKACDEFVRCSACNTEWEDVSQYTTWKKTQIMFRSFFAKRNEFSSNIFEEIFTNLCPKCDVHIQKNGGCMHMTCSKCKFEFCWLCKQQWKAHFPITCGGNFISFLLIAFLIIGLFFNKLGIVTPVFDFIWFIVKYLFRNFIYNNMFFFFVGYFFLNIDWYRTSRQAYYYKSTVSFYFPMIATCIFAIIMLIWMVYHQTLMECLYFGIFEGAIVGGGVGTVVIAACIWDNWLSLVY